VIPLLLDLIPRRKIDVGTLLGNRDIPGLVNALSSRNPDVQSEAMRALGEIGSAAVGQIVPALKQRNRRLRLGAIGALAEIQDPGAVPALAEMMRDPVSEIRWQAAIALGEIGSQEAIAFLIPGLEDADKYVRYGSALSLAKIGYQPAGDAGWAWFYAARQDWDRLRELGSYALPPLHNLLRDNDSEVRVRAVRMIGDIGDGDSGPVLIGALGDPDRQVRWEAVLASQKCGVPPMCLPRGLCRRPRMQKNPLVAGFLNFLLPGLGYGYLGKWWGIMIFQIELSITLWLHQTETAKYGVDVGEFYTYLVLFPLYFLLAIHAWYLAKNLPEEPA